MTSYDPYVAEPAEPRRPRALANASPAIAFAAILLIVVAVGVLIFTSGSTQDPAVGDRPAQRATEG